MEVFYNHRVRLIEAVNGQLTSFDHALKEQLDLRDAAFTAEKTAFQEEISALRQELSKTKQLEAENKSLRSTLEVNLRDAKQKGKILKAKVKSPSGRSSKKIQGSDGSMSPEINDHYEPNREDYARSVAANKILQERLKQAQQVINQWQEYHQKRSGVSAVRSRDLSVDSVHPAKAQIPNYKGLPSPRSSSHDSKPTSPLTAGAKNALQHRGPALDGKTRDDASPQKRTRSSQDHVDIPSGSESDATAETCQPEFPLDNVQQDAADQEIELPLGPADTPVIVSERTLPPRKTKSSKKRTNPKLYDDKYTQQGSIQKLFHVKSETSSSSPLMYVSHLASTNPQDSMDLDEVGEKHYTPRKRRRLLGEELDRNSGSKMPAQADCIVNPSGADPHHLLLDQELNRIQELRKPVQGEESLATPHFETDDQGKGPGKIIKTYGRTASSKESLIAQGGASIKKPNVVKSKPSKLAPNDKPDEMLTQHEPLRYRPRNALRPQDFKINPVHNHGYQHPVSEVVRNRDKRKCMQGCKRLNCCGNTFRKVVEVGGHLAPFRKSRLSGKVPVDFDSEDDQQLLEEYLGDDKVRLTGIPEEEREELLFEARVEQFANAWGKHREEYRRQPTPPGFWEADMPDTQQEKKNRAVAKAMEKVKVAEMHREAMRPNGRYKFRDEL